MDTGSQPGGLREVPTQGPLGTEAAVTALGLKGFGLDLSEMPTCFLSPEANPEPSSQSPDCDEEEEQEPVAAICYPLDFALSCLKPNDQLFSQDPLRLLCAWPHPGR